MKKIIVLGATGSIGKSTLDIVRKNKNKFKITALSAHTNEKELLNFADKFKVKNLALSGKKPSDTRIKFKLDEGINELINETEADIVINGIASAKGLLPSVTAIKSGKNLGLANKETIVMAGPIILELAKKYNSTLIPVDSEHSAIFQLLRNQSINNISEIILTASGGAFRETPIEKLKSVNYKDALKHPTWDMGIKITIDSATMANKGLEVIEAKRLFDIDISKIKVLIHPQSSVHSIIRTKDNSMYAQISKPDMRIPILNALSYPEIFESDFGNLDLADKTLTFTKPDLKKFPLLKLAYQAAEADGEYPLVFNAANEIAVEEFIKENISYFGIAEIIEKILEKNWNNSLLSIEQILETDKRVREETKLLIK